MTHLTDAVLTQLDSPNFNFSLHAPAVTGEVWSSIQHASEARCEELTLVGENVLLACFLSVMIKPKSKLEAAGKVARLNGFLTTLRDTVLSPPVYATLVSKAGLRGPSARAASDAFLLFVAALHASLHDAGVLAWFRETFLLLIRVAADAYDECVSFLLLLPIYRSVGSTSANTGNLADKEITLDRHTYAPALEILAQIKTIQSCHSVSSSASLHAQLQKLHHASQLLWGASTFTGAVFSPIGSAIFPAIRLARNTLRDSIPASWTRSRKLNEALQREKTTKRRVSSIMDPRLTSRVGLNTVKDEAKTIREKTEIDPEFVPPPQPSSAASKFASPRRPSAFHVSQVHAPLSSNSPSPSSNVLRPWQYTRAVSASASPSARPNASPNANSPAPAPLRLPRRASLGYNHFDGGSSSNACQGPNLDFSRPRRGRESF